MRAIRNFLPICFLLVFGCLISRAVTTTTLTVTAGANAVTTVNSGTAVTLSAQVNGGTVTGGLVNFCDATATYCSDVHILGSAQLTSAGIATFTFIPDIGSHSFTAAFAGTAGNAASTSSIATLTVTGPYPTTASIVAVGQQGNYSLTATLTGTGFTSPLTGSVGFLDTTANTTLATALVSSSSSEIGLTAVPIPLSLDQNNYQSIAVGDFNGDGKPDVALLNASSGKPSTVNILLGVGDGTFTAGATVNTGNGAQTILVADLNSDGKLDLVTANSDTTLSVLLGNGDGTFAAATSVPFTGGPSLAVGDFNRDGKPDLVGSSSTELIVLLGNGDGTFLATTQAIGLSQTSGLTVVSDFNGDGIADVALASGLPAANDAQRQTGVISVWLGKGDGTFPGVAFQMDTDGVPTAMAAADFNLDGKADLVVEYLSVAAGLDPMGESTSGVVVLLSKGDGTFSASSGSVSSSGLPSPASGMAVADFNHDGKPDIALASLSYMSLSPPPNTPLPIEYGNGDGTFTAGAASTMVGASSVYGSNGQVIATADFNGDGFPDLATLYLSSATSSAAIELYQITQNATVTVAGISATGTGPHLVDASYPGDSNYQAVVSATASIVAGTPTLEIIPPALPSATVTLPYSQTLTAQGGTAPYQFAVTAGMLPAGLFLSSAGVLSGAPTTSGSYLFSVMASDNKAGTPNTTSVNYALVVAPEVVFAVPTSLPPGTPGVAYSETISAYGGTPPYTFAATGLPAGLSISSSGVISGTPTAVGSYSVFVSIADSTPGAPLFGGMSYTLTVATAAGFTLTAPSAGSTVTAGQPATFTLTLAPLGNFSSPVGFSCGSQLPAGAVCYFKPASVTPTGGNPVTSVLTITSVAASTSLSRPPARLSPFDELATRLAGISFAAVFLIGVPRRFNGRRGRLHKWMLPFGMVAAGLLWGCGGKGAPPPIVNPGTPAGTYTISVTAMQSSGANPITQTTTVTLIVQ